MTPQEKAQELVDKCYQLFPLQKDVVFHIGHLSWEYDNWIQAKQCALIAVDEILNTLKIFPEEDTTSKSVVDFSISRIVYWVQVKQEIEKL